MANIQASLKGWSTTEASNQPDSTDSATIAGDLRAIQAGVRDIYSQNTIASAATTDLGSLDEGSLTVSGVVTITALGTVSAGIRKNVVFSGILTLTHNGTSLILPGAANITTAANDRAEFESLGSGNWRCNWYVKADGTAIVGVADGSITYAKLATTVISGATAETAPAIDDLLLINDTSATTVDKITLENMLKVINGLTEDTDPSALSDFALTYDASASGVKKTKLSRVLGDYFYRINADVAGANVSTAQNVFGVGVTLVASTVYEFEAMIALQKSAGTTSHNIGFSFGGTATVNNIGYELQYTYNTSTFVPSSASANSQMSFVATTAHTPVNTGITSAAVFNVVRMRGTVSINGGGTFIPQYTLSAAPGGAYTTKAGAFVRFRPIGAAGSDSSQGTWA